MSHTPKISRYKLITIPTRAHPLVRELYAEFVRLRLNYDTVANATNISSGTIQRLRRANSLNLTTLEALAEFVGMRVVLEKGLAPAREICDKKDVDLAIL